MTSKPFKVVLSILVLTAAAVVLTALHLENTRLRRHVAHSRHKKAALERLQEEARSAKVLLARSEANAADGARAIHEDLLRARTEVAALEQKAIAVHTQKMAQASADAEALAKNRDPEKGLTRLEHFKDVGQVTPSAAFQSLVWAALKGDETVMGELVTMTDEARRRAEAWVATWPADAKPKPTPEKLAITFVSGLLTEVPALQILDASVENGGQTATLNLRVPRSGKSETTQGVPMRRGLEGWQIVVSEGQIERLFRKLKPESAEKK